MIQSNEKNNQDTQGYTDSLSEKSPLFEKSNKDYNHDQHTTSSGKKVRIEDLHNNQDKNEINVIHHNESQDKY